MGIGLKERIKIWSTLAVTGALLVGAYSLLALVESYRAKVIPSHWGVNWDFDARYAGVDFAKLQPCSEQEGTASPGGDASSVGIWKDKYIEIKPAYVEAPESLQYRIVEAKVEPYWSLQPPEIRLTLWVLPKANVELPKGKVSIQFKGCAVLAPEYWLTEEQKADETSRRVLAEGDSETATRAQAYIDELAARKKLLASSWMVEGQHQAEVRSYSSITATLLAVSKYGLWTVIVLAGLLFFLTAATYLMALQAD